MRPILPLKASFDAFRAGGIFLRRSAENCDVVAFIDKLPDERGGMPAIGEQEDPAPRSGESNAATV